MAEWAELAVWMLIWTKKGSLGLRLRKTKEGSLNEDFGYKTRESHPLVERLPRFTDGKAETQESGSVSTDKDSP